MAGCASSNWKLRHEKMEDLDIGCKADCGAEEKGMYSPFEHSSGCRIPELAGKKTT